MGGNSDRRHRGRIKERQMQLAVHIFSLDHVLEKVDKIT